MTPKYLPLVFLCSAGVLLTASHYSLSDTPAPAPTVHQNSHRIIPKIPDAIGDPSIAREDQYVEQVREWLDTLPHGMQERCREIMRNAHPELTDLRNAIREKKAELASLSFAKGTEPEALPRLGVDLQALRASLEARLLALKRQLAREAGVDMGPLDKDSFWLPLPKSVH